MADEDNQPPASPAPEAKPKAARAPKASPLPNPEAKDEPEAELLQPNAGDLVVVHANHLNVHGIHEVTDVLEGDEGFLVTSADASHQRIRVSRDDITQIYRKA